MSRSLTCMSVYLAVLNFGFYTRGFSIATVFTHLSATAWGAFQIYSTDRFHNDFKRLATDGACGINLLPNYWQSRARAEIPSLAFSAAALLVSCVLSFKLIKVIMHRWLSLVQLTSMLSVVIWMANLQARRRLQGDQQNLQAHPDSIHRYTAFIVLRCFSGGSLARSTL